MPIRHPYKDILFGVSVADAVGVPVEFKSRATIALQPVTDMIGYGTYRLPPGTWSDDSSLTFCLAEALTKPFSLEKMADYFIRWRESNYWTPLGEVFDIGNATSAAISLLVNGCPPELAGGTDVSSNGNGSLMRIAPLLMYIHAMPIEQRFRLTKQVSSVTHAHIRSVIACFYYLEYMRLLYYGTEKKVAYDCLQAEVTSFLQKQEIDDDEISIFDRILQDDISLLPEEAILSSGYVLHTLEAAMWCLLTTDSYAAAVLKAVNLGSDTDTTAAVTGGLAGLLYGYEKIPTHWVSQLARKNDIDHLAERMKKQLEM